MCGEAVRAVFWQRLIDLLRVRDAVDDAKHLRQRGELGGERFCAVKCVLRDFRAAEGLEIFRDIGTDLFDRQVDFQIGKNTV